MLFSSSLNGGVCIFHSRLNPIPNSADTLRLLDLRSPHHCNVRAIARLGAVTRTPPAHRAIFPRRMRIRCIVDAAHLSHGTHIARNEESEGLLIHCNVRAIARLRPVTRTPPAHRAMCPRESKRCSDGHRCSATETHLRRMAPSHIADSFTGPGFGAKPWAKLRRAIRRSSQRKGKANCC